MPKITVIVPVYKVEAYLHRCIDSILGQTFSDFELILVDDGSPDGCGAICDGYAARDSRIVVIHQQNGGLSAARNTGIEWAFANSDSEWLSFIDSDDWVHPRYLELLLRAVQENHVDVSMGLLLLTEEDCVDFPELRGEIRLCDPEALWVEYNMDSMVAYNKLIRREIFRELRFPVGRIYEDLYTTYQYFFRQNVIAFVDEKLYYYYQRADSIIHEAWSLRKLHVIDGQNNALRFFRKHRFERAEELHLGAYLRNLSGQCWIVQALPDVQAHRKTLRILRRNLRRVLYRYRKYQKLPLEANAGIYNEAFPCTMAVYWTARAVIGKLKGEGLTAVLRKALKRLRKQGESSDTGG